MDGGGKRFRPLLVLLASQLGRGADPADVQRLAVAVEFIHTATLLHDDVVAQSDVRRGKRVAYRIWGAEPSVLSGDYLYSRAFNLLTEVGELSILDALSSATTQMARGEVLQLLRSYSTATTREEYLEVIRGKTASLISASCRSAGILGGLGTEAVCALERFGMDLGLAFQIMDDVLDYSADRGALGKAVGKDFTEGKVTLPVIILLEQLAPEARQKAVGWFVGETPSEEDFAAILHLMKGHGTLAAATDVALEHGKRAASELDCLPDGAARMSLADLCTYVIRRQS